MSILRLDASLKRLLVLCSVCLLLGVRSVYAQTTARDGIQRADLRVTPSEFTQQTLALGLSGEELILAKGAWGSLTFDLTHVDPAYETWFEWYAAGPPIYKMDDPMLASIMRDWWSSMEQNLATLRLSAVDRYFAQMEALRPNDRQKIQSWRRRHYRKLLSISRSSMKMEGVNTDLVALLEDLEQDYPNLQLAKLDLPIAAQDFLESYELQMHELIMQNVQVAIAHRKLQREGFDFTQDDRLRGRIEIRSKQTIAPEIVAIDIRRLNRSTIDRLARVLPRDSANVFRKLALKSVSPFAYTPPYYERLAEYAIESSLIESDVKDALQGLINTRKKRRLKLAEKVEQRYESRYTANEVLNAERVYFEINAGLRGYDKEESKAERKLKVAKRELGSHDMEGLAKVRQLLGRSFVAVRDARASENQSSKETEEAAKAALAQTAIESNWPRNDSPFMKRLELEEILDSINVVEADSKQTILSHYDAFATSFRNARRTHDRERAKLTPISEVANLEDPVERGRRSTVVVMQHGEVEQKWLRDRRVIEGGFKEQVARELTDDQTDDWYREVRRLRRFRMITLLQSHYVTDQQSRDLFDLLEFLDDLKIEFRTNSDINSIVESYEIEMDGALRKFEERHEIAQQRMMQLAMQSNQTQDPVDVRRVLNQKDKVDDLRGGSAELNLQYVLLISETLTDEDSTTFRAAVRQQMYPWANVTSPVEMVFQAFHRDQSLSKDRQTIINGLLSHYRSSRDPIIEALIRLVRKWTDEADTDRKTQFLDRAERSQLDRVLLEKDTLTFIRELFNPDQLESFALDIRLLLSPVIQP